MTYTANTPSSPLPVGDDAITAVYGYGNLTGATSPEADVEIDPDFSVTGPGSATSGGDATYTAAIIPDAAGDSPGGSLDFTLAGGTYSHTFSSVSWESAATGESFNDLSAGMYTLTVSYSGDSNYPEYELTRHVGS